jgi:hypothetical protein
MTRTLRTPRRAALAALALLGAAACTDVTVEPRSNIAAGNAFADPGAYRALVAKGYSNLALSSGQGGGTSDIQGIDAGFSQYLRLLWQMQELPTDEAVIAWGDGPLQELNTQSGRTTTRSSTRCTTASSSRRRTPTTCCGRPPTTSSPRAA